MLVAGFTALALMRGTSQHDFSQIYEALESNGANLGIDGGTHTIGFYGHALTEDLGCSLERWQRPCASRFFPLIRWSAYGISF